MAQKKLTPAFERLLDVIMSQDCYWVNNQVVDKQMRKLCQVRVSTVNRLLHHGLAVLTVDAGLRATERAREAMSRRQVVKRTVMVPKDRLEEFEEYVKRFNI